MIIFFFFRESHNVETCDIISFGSEHISQKRMLGLIYPVVFFFPDFTDISIVADKLQSFFFFSLSLLFFIEWLLISIRRKYSMQITLNPG